MDLGDVRMNGMFEARRSTNRNRYRDHVTNLNWTSERDPKVIEWQAGMQSENSRYISWQHAFNSNCMGSSCIHQ